MKNFFSIVLLLSITSCGVQHRFTASSEGLADSSYVYALPYPAGRSYLLIQGYNSGFSHKGRLSLDFKMKKGSPVTAARAGVVVRVQQDYKKGGISKKFLGRANQVVIRHSDGSQAMYAHLQYRGALVKPGDTVQKGQQIGLSGSTGYSAMPHLHFIVWGPTPRGRGQLPTRFRTHKGDIYLKPGKRYKAPTTD
ncbi:MAG TPA: M23 family metallopeptidase [Flavisolibacter sp.]|nr:M23 family metallopeptidase [Flavisolibacter sp.]